MTTFATSTGLLRLADRIAGSDESIQLECGAMVNEVQLREMARLISAAEHSVVHYPRRLASDTEAPAFIRPPGDDPDVVEMKIGIFMPRSAGGGGYRIDRKGQVTDVDL